MTGTRRRREGRKRRRGEGRCSSRGTRFNGEEEGDEKVQERNKGGMREEQGRNKEKGKDGGTRERGPRNEGGTRALLLWRIQHQKISHS
jgi:hypothetical protein